MLNFSNYRVQSPLLLFGALVLKTIRFDTINVIFPVTVIAQGYDYAVVIMIVISNHS